ncbi:MAG: T9SS C-terminal target domain-containing protein [Verrucomicrobiae bacterium]|nr:T9SS C-terminal target domain-containing protein [Verrucomicrobiae bacterium]
MKKLIPILALVALGSSAFADDLEVTSDITADTTWTADTAYKLGKPIFVTNGAVLTIEPGTKIYGYEDIANQTFGSLIITRGCKIMAEGTPSSPIIFTALAERDGVETAPGVFRDIEITDVSLWGGLILLGNAIVNGPDNAIINPNTTNPPTFQVEGFPAGSNDLITYGGSDDHDNSGVLRFVSIRYGGYEFAEDEEINGLTLGAVGDGTTIEFVEVFNNSDDGVEFFGGTVNTKFMVMAFNEDECFDTDQGYRGRNQFWFAIQKDVGNGSNYGSEQDGGDGDDKTLMPYSTLLVSNATLIGSGVGGSNPQDNATFRWKDNATPTWINSVFTDFKQYGIRVDDDTTVARFNEGLSGVEGSVWGAFGTWAGTAASLTKDSKATEVSIITGMNNSNTLVGDAIIVESISRTPDGNLDPRVLDLDGPVYDTSNMVALDDDPFWTEVDFKGAVGTFNWLKGWTALDEKGYLKSSAADLDTNAEFSNISTRALVGVGANEEMNLGFIISGVEPQTVYITAKGPSLAASGVASPLDDPILTLVDPTTGNPIDTNSSWKESSERGLIEATSIPPSDDSEAAIVATLPPGRYTALVESESGNPGVAIGEVYRYR